MYTHGYTPVTCPAIYNRPYISRTGFTEIEERTTNKEHKFNDIELHHGVKLHNFDR